MTSVLKDKCNQVNDVKAYLEYAYMSNVAVEFEHIQNEEERLWLYENYEKHMHAPVTPGEQVKAL